MVTIYWEKVIRRFFPEAQNLSEDWNAKTVSFDILPTVENINLNIDYKTMEKLKVSFGPKIGYRFEIRSAGELCSSMGTKTKTTGAILKVIILDVKFPAMPE